MAYDCRTINSRRNNVNYFNLNSIINFIIVTIRPFDNDIKEIGRIIAIEQMIS